MPEVSPSVRSGRGGVILGLVLAGLVAGGLHQAWTIRRLGTQVEALEERAGRAEERAHLAEAKLKAAPAMRAPPPAGTTAATAAPLVSSAANLVERVERMKQLLAQMPDKAIPELALLTDEDWLVAVKGLSLETEGQARWALSEARKAAKMKFNQLLMGALERYAAANGGVLPEDLEAVAPYFTSPVEPGVFARYALLRKGNLAAAQSGAGLVGERPDTSVDDVYDTEFKYSGSSWSGGQRDNRASIFQFSVAKFREANGGRNPESVHELRPFLPELYALNADLAEMQPFLDLERRSLAR